MSSCRITVLKRTVNEDLADHIKTPLRPCEAFEEGQQFLVPDTLDKPADFCSWAWNDLYKSVVTLARGGNFADGAFAEWMKDERAFIACCTDGMRPVIFKVERVED